MDTPRNPGSENHHVHFDISSDQMEKNNDITLKKIDDNTIEVHLGFLRVKHKYLISFSIPRDMLKIERTSQLLVQTGDEMPYINCRINDSNKDEDKNYVNFEIEYQTLKNRLIDEIINFRTNGSDNERIISLILKSRVLGMLKGTPLLKNGVHCTGVLDLEEDSDTSE